MATIIFAGFRMGPNVVTNNNRQINKNNIRQIILSSNIEAQ